MASRLYTPLAQEQRQIRLLHLAPAGNFEDEIICSLSLASLQFHLQYEALSYFWGDAAITRPIKVYDLHVEREGSQNEGHIIDITTNLYSALRHMRRETEVRVLWADALCINQSDLDERSNQIPLMGEIYSRALSVIIWLGELGDGDSIAMDIVELLGRDDDLHISASFEDRLAIDGVGLECEEFCKHLARFFSRSWWKRIWTVQELVLANHATFQCGRRLILMEVLFRFTENLAYHNAECCHSPHLWKNLKGLGTSAMAEVSTVCLFMDARDRIDGYGFLYLLSQFRNNATTDDRDRIYGMLSLTPDLSFKPDYSLSVQQVYERFVITSTQNTRNLDILSHLFGERKLDLPSFVPDFTAPVKMIAAYLHRINSIRVYSTSGESLATFDSLHPGKVSTRGFILDTILTKVYLQSGVEKMERVAELSSDDDTLYKPTGEIMRAAFACTFSGSLERQLDSELSHYFQRISDSSFQISIFEKWKAWQADPEAAELGREVREFNHVVQINTQGRDFIKTSQGLIGFGPVECCEGDLVAVLAGGKVPYILRLASGINHEGSPCYIVLGTAYIHGIMDGEAWKDVIDEEESQVDNGGEERQTHDGSIPESGPYKLREIILV